MIIKLKKVNLNILNTNQHKKANVDEIIICNKNYFDKKALNTLLVTKIMKTLKQLYIMLPKMSG